MVKGISVCIMPESDDHEDYRDNYHPPDKPPELIWISRRDQPVNRFEWVVYERKQVATMFCDENVISTYVSLEAVERVIDGILASKRNPSAVAAVSQLKRDIQTMIKPRELSEEEAGYPNFTDGGTPLG